jgi:hypothetical protein
VKRGICNLTGVLFLVAVTAGWAQETRATPPPTVPAASRSEADCTGFVAHTRVPADIYVSGGADNFFYSRVRQFGAGDSIFLRARGTTSLAPGTEYAIVRPAKSLFETSRHVGEHWAIGRLGTPYEDVGRVKVTRVTKEGAVAEVTFACGPVYPGDLAGPYQPRPIPEYTPSNQFDRFVPANGNRVGVIIAAKNNAAVIGTGDVAYLNLGGNDGAKPGQRYRVFGIPVSTGFLVYPETPREDIGELVILSTQEKSSVGIVVSSTREIFLGEGVELE